MREPLQLWSKFVIYMACLVSGDKYASSNSNSALEVGRLEPAVLELLVTNAGLCATRASASCVEGRQRA